MGSAILQLLSANPAFSQETNGLADTGARHGEIIVTARKVAEPLLRAPLAVTSIPADTIRSAGLDDIADLTAYAPNVDINGGIAGQLQGQISIRGISTLVRNIGLETGVGIYVDGVYVGRPENFAQHLLDVSRVEIARGPQGTEFGKNTIAGVIHAHTVQPDSEPSGFANVNVGNYGLIKGEAAVGIPLSDKLSARAAIAYANQDGIYKHLSGGKDAGSTDLLTWRLTTKFTPDDDLSFTLRGDGLRDRGTPAFFQAGKLAGFPDSFPGNQPLRINNNRPNSLKRDSYGVSLTAEWNTAALSIVSITAYRDSDYQASLDDDQEQVDFVAADNFGDTSHFFSQELRASGTAGRLQYLIGAYYFDQVVRTDRKIALGADLGVGGEPGLTTRGAVKTKSAALFGRLDYDLTDQLELSAGLRYTHEKKRARFHQEDETGVFTFLGFPDLDFDGRWKDDDLSPSLSLSYAISEGINAYARFARGYKSAAFNVDIASSVDGLTARPEQATTYEVGLKTLLQGGDLGLNLAAFHTDYGRLQVSQVLGTGLALTNAANAKSRGIEAELFAQVLPFLRFEGNAAILDAHYKHFPNCGVPASVGGGVADCGGNDLVLAPHFSGHGAVQFDLPTRLGDLFARADLDYRSTVYFEPTNAADFKADKRTLIDLRIGLRRGAWTITGWVQNVTNERYRVYMDDRSGIGIFQTVAYGSPRTYGLGIRSEW